MYVTLINPIKSLIINLINIMRCNNCGWNNPDGISKCQKCNQPLTMETVPMSQDDGLATIPLGNLCPNCGYALSEGTIICPICKTEIKKADDGIGSVPDFENSQKTVIIDDSKNNPVDQQADFKHTVVDVPPVHTAEESFEAPKKVDLKKTVCDFSRNDDKEESKEQDATNVVTKGDQIIETEPNEPSIDSQQFSYVFECMDSDEHDKIELISNNELLLKEDEVILIAGLRFRRI